MIFDRLEMLKLLVKIKGNLYCKSLYKCVFAHKNIKSSLFEK